MLKKDLSKNQWIYTNTPDNQARFLLGEKGNKTLICIGINPSTAEPEKLDRTLSTVKRYSQDLGYDSWMMLNIYPQRATNPDDLDNELNIEYHKENLRQIETIFSQGNHDIWAAWGTLIQKRAYLKSCLEGIVKIAERYNCKWYSMGEPTKEGHPHHPLYLKKNLSLEPIDINGYMSERKCIFEKIGRFKSKIGCVRRVGI